MYAVRCSQIPPTNHPSLAPPPSTDRTHTTFSAPRGSLCHSLIICSECLSPLYPRKQNECDITVRYSVLFIIKQWCPEETQWVQAREAAIASTAAAFHLPEITTRRQRAMKNEKDNTFCVVTAHLTSKHSTTTTTRPRTLADGRGIVCCQTDEKFHIRHT